MPKALNKEIAKLTQLLDEACWELSQENGPHNKELMAWWESRIPKLIWPKSPKTRKQRQPRRSAP